MSFVRSRGDGGRRDASQGSIRGALLVACACTPPLSWRAGNSTSCIIQKEWRCSCITVDSSDVWSGLLVKLLKRMPLHDKQVACYGFLTVHGPEACLVSGAQEFWPRQSKDLEGLREHSVKTGAVRPGPPICHKESTLFNCVQNKAT